ncbi:MAG: hypothetical protein EHM43_09390 [Ignavibacteriae bacterium]|nr:MAG: hypothetical protein EHM43_09390 [Ignavibacteriota bacterium]
MITALILGTVVGYILAIPPGPIGMAAIRTGMHQGWIAAVKLAIGAGLSDIIYCALAMVATSAVVGILTDLENSTPLATVIFQLVIVIVMIGFGIMQMKEKPVKHHDENVPVKELKPRNVVEWFKSHGPFFVGVGFAVANLANPSFIPSLAAMTTFIQKLEWFGSTMGNNLAFAVGFGLGNTLWLFTLARLVIANRKKLTQTFILRIQQVTGVTLIGFGTFYGLRVLIVTKWGDLLRFVFAA